MKAFAELYAALDRTTKTNDKVDALKHYLSAAQPEDAAWAVNFLIGRRPKRLLESRKLAQWAIEEAGVPDWLFRRVVPRGGRPRRDDRAAAAAGRRVQRASPALLGRRTAAAAARGR